GRAGRAGSPGGGGEKNPPPSPRRHRSPPERGSIARRRRRRVGEGALAADLPHLARKAFLVELVQVQTAAGILGRHAISHRTGDLLVGTIVPEQCGEVRLIPSEQAVANLAVGGQANPVAVGAERFS